MIGRPWQMSDKTSFKADSSTLSTELQWICTTLWHMLIQLRSVVVCFDWMCSNQLVFEGNIHLTVTLKSTGRDNLIRWLHTHLISVWQTTGYSLDSHGKKTDCRQSAAMLMLFDFCLFILSSCKIYSSPLSVSLSFLLPPRVALQVSVKPWKNE